MPRLTHRQHSRRAVVAHTGQDHPNRITPRLFGDRMEQHIYRRPMTVNRRAIVNFDLVICATTRQLHMPIARRNIGMPRQDTFSVFGFFNPDLAKLIKSVGKERVKPGGICWVINNAGLESGNGCST